jgi:TonB family protein
LKLPLLSLTIAAGLFAATPTPADAEIAPPQAGLPIPPPVSPKPSPMMAASMAMVREIGLVDHPDAPLRERLDALVSFRHSPETAQKLVKIYGSEKPWTLERAPAALKDRFDYLGRLAPSHYASELGETWDWAEMRLTMSLDKASRNLSVRGDWASLVMEDKNTRFAMRDLRLTGKHTRDASGLWFGDTQVDIAGVKVDAKAQGVGVAFDGLRFKTTVTGRPKSLDIGYVMTVKGIDVAGERIDNFTLATRVTNIDKATMVEMKAFGEKRNTGAGAATAQEQAAALAPLLKTMGKAAIQRGTAIEIDELSARYHGNTASLKGSVSAQGATEADLDSMAALGKRIVAHFDVKVPVALLRDISTAVATRQANAQAKAQGSAQANPQSVAQMAQSMTDIMVGKAINNGYARIENDVLVSSIDLRGGVLRINGKQIALPTATTSAAPAGRPAPSLAAAGPALLRARRIDERCSLPDYPQEAVRLDAPLRLAMRFTVGADGTLRDVALTTPSQYPAWDKSVLAAAARCVYIPALRNGLPVAVPMTWQVVRTPGSTHP